MIEKAIAASLEPIVDEVLKLEKRISEISLIKGDTPTPQEVAKELCENHLGKIKGKEAKALDVAIALYESFGEELHGMDGADAVVDYDSIVDRVVASPELVVGNSERIDKQFKEFIDLQNAEVDQILYG